MEHSPSWEANRFPASQEIPRILWNPTVPYCLQQIPPFSHVSLTFRIYRHDQITYLKVEKFSNIA